MSDDGSILRAPHLKSVPGHEGIERHILGLKGRHAKAVLPQYAQDPRCQYALARTGHSALDHQITCHTYLPAEALRGAAHFSL